MLHCQTVVTVKCMMASEGQHLHVLSLMEAPSDSCFRNILNKLVNFKAANLLLQHVTILNQGPGEKMSCLFPQSDNR